MAPPKWHEPQPQRPRSQDGPNQNRHQEQAAKPQRPQRQRIHAEHTPPGADAQRLHGNIAEIQAADHDDRLHAHVPRSAQASHVEELHVRSSVDVVKRSSERPSTSTSSTTNTYQSNATSSKRTPKKPVKVDGDGAREDHQAEHDTSAAAQWSRAIGVEKAQVQCAACDIEDVVRQDAPATVRRPPARP